MKLIKTLLLLLCGILFSCHIENKKTSVEYFNTQVEKINDSITDVINWTDSVNGTYFRLYKKDTVSTATVTKKREYLQYKYPRSKLSNKKLKMFIKMGDEYKLNEIVYFDENDKIIEDESTYIVASIRSDSIKLSFPLRYFNRTQVVIGEESFIDIKNRTKAETLNSANDFIVIAKNLTNNKCVLIGIKDSILQKNKKYSKVESSLNIFFDLNNLLRRDVNNSLLAN
jgi:hypothetical protein